MNKFLTNLGQTFSDDEKAVIKNKLENILGTDQVKMAWIPTVADNGLISWTLASYTTQPPETMNIKGPQGEPGENGENGADGTSVTITNVEEEGRTHVVKFSDGKSITITDGVDGAGVAIKGTVNDKADLAAIENPENGDAYIVKNDSGKLYVYANGWPDEGVDFTGPQGERGETPSFSFIDGETGIEIHVNDSEDPVAVIPYAVDGHSPTLSSKAVDEGYELYADTTLLFTVRDGVDGTTGKDGYTPSLTISSVTSTEHTAGGTELKFTYPESWQTDVVFTAWNGNDGKDWDGTTGRLIQGDFIKLTPTGDDLEISVTGDFVTSSTIVGTDQYALTTAGWAKVQGGGEGSTYLFDSTTLSGDGTEGNEIGVDTSALAKLYVPMSGAELSGTDNVVRVIGVYPTQGALGVKHGYLSVIDDTTNCGDFHSDANAAWIKYSNATELTASHNTGAVRLGVGKTTEITAIGQTEGRAVGMMNDATDWGDTKYIYGMRVHSAGTTSATDWIGDNTLHFVLE